MKTTKNRLMITPEDYAILNSYVRGVTSEMDFDRNNAALLEAELKKAVIIKRDKFPQDVVRLNSRVLVKEEKRDKIIELVLVVPERANILEKKISVFAPIGTALIGFKQGERIRWDVPAGSRTFTIMKVDNQSMS
jgi:regulator of nucleoside diphosphate kinase